MHPESRFALWKIALVLATSSALFFLGLHNIHMMSTFGLLDDGVYWQTRNGRVEARRVAPDGPAAEAGLRQGDVLVMLDGTDVDVAEDVRRFLDLSVEGQQLTYQVLREHEQQAFAISIAPLPRGNVGLYYFLASVGLFSLVVGTVVYVRRRGVAATAHFYLLCLFWCLAYSFSLTGRLNTWDSTYYWMDRVGVLFFPPLFLHFALCFPERKPLVERKKWLLPLLYVPSLLLVYLAVLSSLLFLARAPWSDGFFLLVNRVLDRLIPFYVSVLSLAAFAAFVHSYRHARNITVKKQTKWIVWGTGFGTSPFALLYATPYLFGVEATLAMELSVIPLAFIPISFAYAIVKYRLMDVEVIFKRGVVYTLAGATVVGVYLLIFFTGTRFLVHEPHNSIIAVLATLAVVLLATPIKSKIQRGIDRLFYRERFDYRQALQAFSRDLNAHLDIDRLSARLVERIHDTFEVDKVALLVANDGGDELAVLAGEGLTETEWKTVRITAPSALLNRLKEGDPVYYGESGWSSFHTVAGSHDDGILVEGLQYAIPCLAQGKVVGVILLGRHWDQSAISTEDMELLLTLSGQAATALENARLYRSLELKAEQFERLKEHSENTIESLEAGILVLDLSGKVLRWNRALERLYGMSREEALGHPVETVFPPAFQEILRARVGEDWWGRAEPAGVTRLNLLNRRGQNKVVKLQVGPFVSEAGETEGTILIFEDITDRVERERELQLREKMASLGLLAAGVAHEVNTPLTGISSFTQMLREQIPRDDSRAKLLEKIERQTERASKIVNSLLNFARQGRSDFVPVDLNEVISDVLSLLEHQLKRTRITLRRELHPELPRVLGDENKLQQVFLNLILNAQDAMPSGGWLTIKTSSQNSQVVIDVSDTGHGMSTEDIRRIYDPFFTTKKGGRGGTGLGLSLTYGIIQEHSGQISVDSVVEKGTCFRIKLPIGETMTENREHERKRNYPRR